MGWAKEYPTYKSRKDPTVFGHIADVPVGSTFQNRRFVYACAVHNRPMGGIAGKRDEGCYSIVMSGGYEDDLDGGDEFIYTGSGGRKTANGDNGREDIQTSDQTFDDNNNAALVTSSRIKNSVRVVRGSGSASDYAPQSGYRYDGLYIVERAWMDMGKSGFKVCRFAFKRIPGQRPIPRRSIRLRGDLSRWEKPKHFAVDHKDVPDDYEEIAADSSPSDRSANRRANTGTSAPRSRDAGPSRPLPPPRPMPPAEPIPPTTNNMGRRPPPPAARMAPSVDVMALMGEMSGAPRANPPAPPRAAAPAPAPQPPRAAPRVAGPPHPPRAAAAQPAPLTIDPRRRPPANAAPAHSESPTSPTSAHAVPSATKRSASVISLSESDGPISIHSTPSSRESSPVLSPVSPVSPTATAPGPGPPSFPLFPSLAPPPRAPILGGSRTPPTPPRAPEGKRRRLARTASGDASSM